MRVTDLKVWSLTSDRRMASMVVEMNPVNEAILDAVNALCKQKKYNIGHTTI